MKKSIKEKIIYRAKEMAFFVIWFSMFFLCFGCQARTAADLLAYDAIEETALQVRMGLDQYEEEAIKAAETQRDDMLTKLTAAILSEMTKNLPEDEAEIMSNKLIAKLKDNLNVYNKASKKRTKVYSITVDNLSLIVEICRKAKDLVMYQANIDSQWKQYIDVQKQAIRPSTGE